DATVIEPEPHAALGIGGQGCGVVLVSQSGPGEPLHLTPRGQAEETLLLICDPKVATLVLGDGVHVAVGNSAHGDEPVVLEIYQASPRRGPDRSVAVREQRMRALSLELADSCAAAGRRNRDRPAAPAVQSAGGAEPYAAIPGREDRPDGGSRHALAHSEGRDG